MWLRPGKMETSNPAKATDVPHQLLGDIRKMIEETRAGVAAAVNAGMTMLYWRIGSRINQEFWKESALITERKLSLHCRDH